VVVCVPRHTMQEEGYGSDRGGGGGTGGGVPEEEKRGGREGGIGR